MIAPFFVRSLVDRVLYRERQREAGRAEPAAHDLTSRPADLALPSGAFAGGKPLALVTVHVTDVDGGFGVSSAQLRAAGGDYAEALLRRYHGCAYHRIVSRRVGLVTNHPLTLRTSHGNAGNAGVGWAIDCGHRERLSADFVEAAKDSLEDLILDTYEFVGRTVVVVPHRAWSKKRTADTSAEVWSRVVRPTVDRIAADYMTTEHETVAQIGYDVVNGGLPIPLSWDDRALFDDKGRRLQ